MHFRASPHFSRIAVSPILAALFAFAAIPPASARDPAPQTIRGEIIIHRSDAAWQSQQLQEACILPNPRDPSRLVMFYSGVPKSDRFLCEVGKAWASVSDPFTWHQDPANPVFGPRGSGWDARTLRPDTVLHVPEEDAYYLYYSGTAGNIQTISDSLSHRSATVCLH
ncbi:MAG: hypothetical protein HS122_20115 [Opitutaceae bacterium]|nr:hypothetical protein [Opitutaceae bacterium]